MIYFLTLHISITHLGSFDTLGEMSGQQVGAVALVAVASSALAKLGYSLVSAPKESLLTVFVHQIHTPHSSATRQNELTEIGSFSSACAFNTLPHSWPPLLTSYGVKSLPNTMLQVSCYLYTLHPLFFAET